MRKRSMKIYREIRQWFGSQRLQTKLFISIGLLFICLLTMLSVIIIQQGKNILNRRLEETCTMVMRHVSQAIKDELLMYYRPDLDENSRTVQLGSIRETILSIYNENMEGLSFVEVVDRRGRVIAHTRMERLYEKIAPADSARFANLTETIVQAKDATIEYVHPLYVRADEKRIFVGATVLGFDRAVILRPIRQATQAILGLTVIVVLSSIFFIFLIAKRMTLQIEALDSGLRQVAKGDLQVSIPVLSNDELGQLAQQFNTMIVHLREKLQMQKFVSSLTMQMIHKRSNADHFPQTGERRMVTVLFSDVRSFTQLTETLGAEEIVKLVNIYLDLQARLVEEHGGIVDKFMGDQVMALFLGEDQEDRAVETAVRIQKAISLVNHQRNERNLMVLEVGCGLQTGEAILGHMGSKNRLDYTVVGDVVNLAARLCALAKPGQIILPQEMTVRLNERHRTVPLPQVRVKGRTAPVDISEVDYDRDFVV